MSNAIVGSPAQQWRQLVHAAVLGGDRSAQPVSGVERIDAMVQHAAPTETWLRAAAAMSLYLRAGWKPVAVEAATEPPGETHDVACSQAAALALESILHGEFGVLLETWCRAAARASRTAPAEHLPALLDAMECRETKSFADALRAVVGERGRWLSQQRPQWQTQSLDVTPDESLWETGSIEQRLACLRYVRSGDAVRGRELLAATWSSESHEDRATLLGALSIGLSLDDEPFLEAALDDSRKPVRQEAASLLTRLPHSALSRRLAERAKRMVVFSSGLLRRKLTVTPPETLDAQLKRDGVESRKRGNLGERAVMLSEIVAVAPLATWAGVEPAQWIDAASKTDWAEALLRGWCAATGRQQQSAWARALAERHLATLPLDQHPPWQQEMQHVLPHVEREMLVKLVTAQVRKHGLAAARPWLDAIDAWPSELSRMVLTEAQRVFAKPNSNYDWTLRDWLKEQAGLRMDAVLADAVTQGWPRDAEHWNDKLAEMVARIEQALRLRQTIQREFIA